MLSICNDGWPLLCDQIKISSFHRPKYTFALSQTVTRKSKVQYSTVCQGSDSSIRDILLIMCQMRSNRLNFHPIQSFYAIHTEESKSNHDSGIGASTCSGKYNAIERNSCGEFMTYAAEMSGWLHFINSNHCCWDIFWRYKFTIMRFRRKRALNRCPLQL